MRFHTDPHVALALLEHRVAGLCNDGSEDLLGQLTGAIPQVAEVAGGVADAAAPVLGAAGELLPLTVDAGNAITGVIDNSGLSAGVLSDIFGSGGIDPSLIAGLGTEAVNNSLSADAIASLFSGGGGGTTGISLPGLATGGGGPTPGGGIRPPTLTPMPSSPAPSGTAGPAPWSTPDTSTRIDNSSISAPAANLGAGSAAVSPPAPTGGGTVTGDVGGGGAGGGGAGAKSTGLLGGISNFLRENGPLLSLGGLAASALMPKQQIPNLASMTGNANLINSTAASLIPAVSTGVLPAGAEQMVKTATNDAVTNIKAKYANLGLAGSTMEAQDIAAANERAQAMRFQIADELTKTGLNAAGLSDQIYAQIAQLILGQDKSLADAIAGFSQAMAYGGAVAPRAAA